MDALMNFPVPDTILLIGLLFGAGIVASFINMMAGGGSMLTVGLMILLGVDPSVANGTNRIGVLVGTASGALAFRSEKFMDLKQSLLLGAFAIPGAILGSIFSVSISDALFQKILASVMIFVMISLFLPQKSAVKEADSPWLIYPAMVVVGFYGGFIQIGVGFLLMAVFRHLMALDLVHTNMHKVFVVLIYTIPILLVFGLSGNIDWLLALSLSAGNAIGSWISVKLAIRKGDGFVKVVLAITVALMAAKLFFSW